MRILFLVHRLPYPPNKGEKMRALGELEALSRLHEVDVFCFYDDPADAQHIDALRKHCQQCYAVPIPWLRGRMQALAAALSGRSFTLGFFRSSTMAARVQEALASRRYDAIFVYCSAVAQYVQHVRNIPKVLDMVDVDSNKWLQYAETSRPPFSWLWRQEAARLAGYEKEIVQEFSTTLVCTGAEADLLRRTTAGPNIKVLTHLFDVTSFDPHKVEVPEEIKARQPYLVFTGSMDYLPNVDAVTYFHQEIFPLVQAKVPNIQFLIVGRNPTRAVRQLGSDPAVWVTGSVADTRPYLRGAAAAVIPLRIACGLQTKILEALAMGVPIIATPRPAAALPEELQPLVRTGEDASQFCSRIVDVIEQGAPGPDEKMRESMLWYFDRQRLSAQIQDIVSEAVARRQ